MHQYVHTYVCTCVFCVLTMHIHTWRQQHRVTSFAVRAVCVCVTERERERERQRAHECDGPRSLPPLAATGSVSVSLCLPQLPIFVTSFPMTMFESEAKAIAQGEAALLVLRHATPMQPRSTHRGCMRQAVLWTQEISGSFHEGMWKENWQKSVRSPQGRWSPRGGWRGRRA